MRALAQRAAPAKLGRVGLAGTLLLHGAVIGTFLFAARQPAHRAALPAYRVELIAAPRASGTNAPAAAQPTAAPDPAPAPAPTRRAAPPAVHQPTATSRVPAPTARPATPATPPARPATAASSPAVAGHAPAAAANPAPPNGPPVASPNTNAAPGTGTAPATIRTEGVEFPFPGYLRNLVAQVYRRWHPPSGATDLESEMLFFVHRDGTVTGLQFVRRSGSFAFDLEAQGAVEAAARAGVFGPLPTGFGPDLLPVSFFFSPRALR